MVTPSSEAHSSVPLGNNSESFPHTTPIDASMPNPQTAMQAHNQSDYFDSFAMSMSMSIKQRTTTATTNSEWSISAWLS